MLNKKIQWSPSIQTHLPFFDKTCQQISLPETCFPMPEGHQASFKLPMHDISLIDFPRKSNSNLFCWNPPVCELVSSSAFSNDRLSVKELQYLKYLCNISRRIVVRSKSWQIYSKVKNYQRQSSSYLTSHLSMQYLE